MSRILKSLITITVLIFFISPAALWFFSRPIEEGNTKSVYFKIERGQSVTTISGNLKKENLIRNALFFKAMSRILRKDRSLKSGYYKLNKAMSAFVIINMLNDGNVVLEKYTVAEGKNMYEVALILERASLLKAEEFLRVASDTTFLRKIGIEAKTAEGYLYPSTYYIAKGNDAKAFVEMMFNHFKEVVAVSSLNKRAKEMGLTAHEIIIIASIIEKESVVESERPFVSSVIYNRLKKGMPLQMDPTVIYAKTIRNGRAIENPNITIADLRKPHAYNTYTVKRLPEGPICSPSLSSITAALYPAKSDYLYFVATGNGTHIFSDNYKTHKAYVEQYQKRQ